MAVIPIEGRSVSFEIDPGTGYVEVKGIEELTLGAETSDSTWTTKEDAGCQNGLIASRGKTIKVKGKLLVDPATGTRDPGQAAVETAAALVGYASLVSVRITPAPSDQSTPEEFSATIVLDDVGGDINKEVDWGFTATRRGASS
jgi:hypothetical protein